MSIDLSTISGAKYEKIYPDTWYSPDCGVELFNGSMSNKYLQDVIDNLHIETNIGIIQAASINRCILFVRINEINYTVRFIFAGNLHAIDVNSDVYNYFCYRHYNLNHPNTIIGVTYAQLHKEFIDRIFIKYIFLGAVIMPDIANIILNLMLDERLYVI